MYRRDGITNGFAFCFLNEYNRDRLPAVAAPHGDISLWSVLKQAIGKELSKITMPIQFNEPLSCKDFCIYRYNNG